MLAQCLIALISELMCRSWKGGALQTAEEPFGGAALKGQERVAGGNAPGKRDARRPDPEGVASLVAADGHGNRPFQGRACSSAFRGRCPRLPNRSPAGINKRTPLRRIFSAVCKRQRYEPNQDTACFSRDTAQQKMLCYSCSLLL